MDDQDNKITPGAPGGDGAEKKIPAPQAPDDSWGYMAGPIFERQVSGGDSAAPAGDSAAEGATPAPPVSEPDSPEAGAGAWGAETGGPSGGNVFEDNPNLYLYHTAKDSPPKAAAPGGEQPAGESGAGSAPAGDAPAASGGSVFEDNPNLYLYHTAKDNPPKASAQGGEAAGPGEFPAAAEGEGHTAGFGAVRPEGADPYNYRFDIRDYDRVSSMGQVSARRSRRAPVIIGGVLVALMSVFILGLAAFGAYTAFYGPSVPGIADGAAAGDTPGLQLDDKPYDTSSRPEINPTGVLTGSEVANLVRPSVVGVLTYQGSQNPAPVSQGSGIIMTSDGYIVTNYHVIQAANLIKVVLDSGDEYSAAVVGTDSRTDLAVLKIDARNLSHATFGNSDQIELCEDVIAIGNPGGVAYAGSVTKGVVSGLKRSLQMIGGYYIDCIQIDAAINPGNSGGPLVNMYGQVIGINSVKITAAGFEGIGFAIPINDASEIIDSLIQHGYVKNRVRLGIRYDVISEVMAKAYNIPEGIYINTIDETSELYKSGARAADIITAINGQSVKSNEDMLRIIQNLRPNQTATITVYRRSRTGQDQTIEITFMLEEDRGNA